MLRFDPRVAIVSAGLKQHDAARLVGVHDRTMQRWLQAPGSVGYRPIPEPALRLLALVVSMPEALEWLAEMEE